MKSTSTKNTDAKTTSAQPFFGPQRESAFFGEEATKEKPFFDQKLLQTKLTVGAPNDPAEREADAIADQIVRQAPNEQTQPPPAARITPLSAPGLQSKPAFESPGVLDSAAEPEAEETPLQQKIQRRRIQAAGAESPPPENLESQLAQSKGRGQPMDPDTQNKMESGFGADFSGVRIHNDANAVQMNRDLGAQAFTRGNDIYFNRDKYAPGSQEGDHLLAHELTHTIQQNGIRKKSIQRAPKKEASGSRPALPVITDTTFEGKKGKIDRINQTIELPLLLIPEFKTKFTPKTNLTIRKGRPEGEKRATQQRKTWDNTVKEKTGIRDALKAKVKKAGEFGPPQNPILYMRIGRKAADKANYLVGTETRILNRLLRPYWRRNSAIQLFEVDHKQEYQLNGTDDIDNLWLLEKEANASSGSKINIKIQEEVEKLRAESAGAQTWNGQEAPEYENLRRNYTITFRRVKGGLDINAKGSDKNPYHYDLNHIGAEAAHLKAIYPLELAQVRKEGLQGSETQITIFNNTTGGRRFIIDLPAGQTDDIPFTRRDFIPGFVPTHLTVTPDRPVIAKIYGKLWSNNPHLDFVGTRLMFEVNKFSGLPHTGRLNVTHARKVIEGLFGAENIHVPYFSPVKALSVRLDEQRGVIVKGKIISTLPFIKGADIDLDIAGDDITLSKTFEPGDISLPPPFKLTSSNLRIDLSIRRFKVRGEAAFEISNLGTGTVRAMTDGKGNFGIKGSFQFDRKLFRPARIEVAYLNGQWSIGGTIRIPNRKVQGIQEATITVAYGAGAFTANGSAKLKIKGIQEGTLGIQFSNEGWTINGGFTLDAGLLPGVKSGSVKAKVTYEEDKGSYRLFVSGKATVDFPGLNSDLDVSYQDGIFNASIKADYNYSKLSGSLNFGVTNQKVDKEGIPSGKPTGAFTAYGAGKANLQLSEYAAGEVGVKVYPDGRITLKGGLSLAKELTLVKKPFKLGPKSLGSLPSGEITIWGAKVFGKKLGIFLTYGGGVSFFISVGPPKLSGAQLMLEEIDPRDLSNVQLTGSAQLDLPALAYLKAELQLGLEGNLVILSVGGKLIPFLKVQVESNLRGGVKLRWSAAKGLELLDIAASLNTLAKVIFGLDAEIYAKLDLWIKTVTVYRERFHLAQKELNFPLDFNVSFPTEMENGRFKPFSLSQVSIKDPLSGKDPKDLLSKGYEEAQNPTPPPPSPAEALAMVRRLGPGPAIYFKSKFFEDVFKKLNRESYYLWLTKTYPDMDWSIIRAELNKMDQQDFERLKHRINNIKSDADYSGLLTPEMKKAALINDFQDGHQHFPRGPLNELKRKVYNKEI